MPLDKTAYDNLEQLFRAQVDRDKAHAIERVVQGWGVYLPCVVPVAQVDYIFVGMEPSFRWADNVQEGERKVEQGARNFGRPGNPKETLALFILSIERFLCHPGETYHLTDVSKGAMPVTVAALDRDRRYGEWYPLLLKEIAIVGKPGAPVVAIGKEVEGFLQKRDLEGTTGRTLYAVQHYSLQASRYYKEAGRVTPMVLRGSRNRSLGTAVGRGIYPWLRSSWSSHTRSNSRRFKQTGSPTEIPTR